MKEIISAKKLDKIAYSEAILAKNSKIDYLTHDAFAEKFKCTYTESIVSDQAQFQSISMIDSSEFKDTRAKAAYERMLNPLENLVICKMSDELGYGLFTTETIPKGTVICLYTGEYNPDSSEFVYNYGSIDAAKIGGLARFMQHQPISREAHEAYLMSGLQDYQLFAIQENISHEEAKKKLNDPEFIAKKTKQYRKEIASNEFFTGYDYKLFNFKDKNLASQVAQSNIAIVSTKVAGVDILLMMASRTIQKNESLGFSYGIMYWKHPSMSQSPVLFTKEGDIIPPKNNYTYGTAPTKHHSDTDESDSYSDDSYDSDEGYSTSSYDPNDQLIELIEKMQALGANRNVHSVSDKKEIKSKASTPPILQTKKGDFDRNTANRFFSQPGENLSGFNPFSFEQLDLYEQTEKMITQQAAIINNAHLPAFNQTNTVKHINQILGATFIERYIDSKRGKWQVEKTPVGNVTLSLQGLQISKKEDCERYKNKFLKASIEAKNIHFDEFYEAHNKIKKYKIRLTCVQNIKLKQEQMPDENLSDYALFLKEMDDQIENIQTAQSLLKLEQDIMKKSPSKGCLRDYQNDQKLVAQAALIKMFEQAKSESSEANYKTIQNKVYREAKYLDYEKTHSKQEAVDAYHTRLSWA